MRRLLAVVFWSVIAAAFIGPGTVTTAASSGSGFGYRLLWALAFSTLATLVLQEAAARVTVVSGRNLGQALREESKGGAAAAFVVLLVLGAVVLGCAAYEAGNILGGVAGAALAVPWPRSLLTLLSGGVAALVLGLGTPRWVANALSVLVAVMGVAFLATAVSLRPPLGALLTGSLVPAVPSGAGLLVLGLVGTTVVPYNLFLGSGIAAGQSLRDLRFGLAVAVLLGGAISMGVLVVGVVVPGPFGYAALGEVLGQRLGPLASEGFAAGLLAAGLSSAITAPFAAAITARGLFARGDDDPRWGARSWRFRAVWGGVLAFGVGFGLADVRPIPAIILAQALNGVLLPVAAIFLALVVNDRRLMGERGLNGALSNTAMALVVAVTLLLGATNLTRAFASALGLPAPGEGTLLAVAVGAALLLAVPVVRSAARRRRR